MKTALLGSFPRPRLLSKRVQQFRGGKFPEDKLMAEISRISSRLLGLAKEAAIDYVTGGNFLWDDIVDMACSQVTCHERNGLMRFYENNFYYRAPVLKGQLETRDQEYLTLTRLFRSQFDKNHAEGAKLKSSLLGPISFASLSQDSYYNDRVEVAFAYSKALNRSMLNVQEVVDAFEIQDPSIFDRRADQKLRSRVSEIYQSLVGGVTKEKHLITYFFLDSSSLKQFFDLPVDVFGLDMIEGRNKMRQIYPFVKERRVYLGVLDSRTTKMERVSSIKRMASRFSAKGASDVIVGFNSFTDFIPEIVASRKVRLLGKVKKA